MGHMLDFVKHSTESGATPIIKPTGSSSGEINDIHESVWIKTVIIYQFTSGFAIKWIMASNLERKQKKKHLGFQSALGKGLWTCVWRLWGVYSLTLWAPAICSHACASAGLGASSPPQNRGLTCVQAVHRLQSQHEDTLRSEYWRNNC